MMKQRASQRGGFTIVEILVVVALVLVLLSIIVVAVNAATRTAQSANTTTLLNSIKQGLIAFKSDVGYLPPVLAPNRDLVWEHEGHEHANGPEPDEGDFQQEIQEWFSVTTLPEYLIGYGPEGEDGYDGPGIRNPGPDGYWGTSVNLGITNVDGDPGTFEYRTAILDPDAVHAEQFESKREGRVLGPYIQLRDERLLGSINPNAEPDANGQFQVAFPGEGNYDPDHPKVIVDYWGEPVRYYRKPYPKGSLNNEYRVIRGGELEEVPTLADVYLLRPWDVGNSTQTTRFADAQGDIAVTPEVVSAEFGLFSSGPDRRLNPDIVNDSGQDGFNQDNLVELGP